MPLPAFALKVIEDKIGQIPQQGYAVALGEYQREDVIQWLIGQGLNRTDLQKKSLYTLGKMYGIPAYLRQFIAVKKHENKKIQQVSRKISSLDFPEAPKTIDFMSEEENSDLEENIGFNLPEEENTTPTVGDSHEKKERKEVDFSQIESLVKSITNKALTNAVTKFNEDGKLFRKSLRDDQTKFFDNIIETVQDKLNLEFADFSKSLIADVKIIAENIAKHTIENLTPRKLEIIHKDHTITLDAEPRHKMFTECLEAISIKEHIYGVGPAGSGKTHMGEQIAKALELEFLPMPQALTKYELSGYLDGSGIYRGTVFRKAIEYGGLLVMDEIDINGASAVAFANSVMANGYCAFPDKMIQAHKDLRIIAFANTYGFGATSSYIGRNPLDAASLDRFTYIDIDYDEDMEKMIFGPSNFITYTHKARSAIRSLKLQHIISMRAIQRGMNGITLQKSPEEICKRALWRNLEPDTISKIKNIAGLYYGENSNLRSVI